MNNTHSQTPTQLRFDALTGFRFLAASMVFIYHNRKFWRHDIHPELLRLMNEFHIGVAMLYVLSGYLIAYTYQDKPIQSGESYLRYILLRCARILPIYWIILTVYFLDPAYGKGNATLIYSLLHGFSSTLNLTGLAQSWSLTVEICFYLFAPIMFLLLRKKSIYIVLSLVGLFAATWVIGEVWTKINGNPLHFLQPLKFIFLGTFAGRSIEFLVGMVVAKMFSNGNSHIFIKIPNKTLFGFMGILITAYCIGLFQPNIYMQGRDTIAGLLIHELILPLFVVMAIIGLIVEKTWLQRILASPILVTLGNASYIFYLIHISYVNLKIKQFFLLPDRNFTILWILSVLLYYSLEKPIYVFCRKWLKR